jgi:hypothetical protein
MSSWPIRAIRSLVLAPVCAAKRTKCSSGTTPCSATRSRSLVSGQPSGISWARTPCCSTTRPMQTPTRSPHSTSAKPARGSTASGGQSRTRPDPVTTLAALLAQRRHFLLDFDGPVCAVFGGVSDLAVADHLREVLAAQTSTSPPPGHDPFAVLRYAATIDAELHATPAEAIFVGDSSTDIEAGPAATSRPSPTPTSPGSAACSRRSIRPRSSTPCGT